jgi:hypothetical protein
VNATDLATVIGSSLTLIALIVLVFELWPAQRVDIFRQQMFALRDELFDFAAQGGIRFDDPAYILLRHLMNGFIRYAHNLTPFRVLFSFLRWNLTSNRSIDNWSIPWTQALSNISNEETKTKLQEFHSKASALVAGQLILSPGLVVTFIVPLTLVALLATQLINLKNAYKEVVYKIPMDFLEEEAAKS